MALLFSATLFHRCYRRLLCRRLTTSRRLLEQSLQFTLLEHLQPGAVYYIRAYALTADGAVYYGNQISVRTADACFIATATFGSLLHPCVEILRDFRRPQCARRRTGQRRRPPAGRVVLHSFAAGGRRGCRQCGVAAAGAPAVVAGGRVFLVGGAGRAGDSPCDLGRGSDVHWSPLRAFPSAGLTRLRHGRVPDV